MAPLKTYSPQSFEAFQRQPYFSALDGLRAFSILFVLLHHSPPVDVGNPLRVFQENGRYGVAFFFVISGFLISTLFFREEAKTGRIHLWKFYGRRSLRLLPLYYAVLALQAILVFGLHQYTPENRQLFVEKLPSYLFYYSNWLTTSTQGPFFCAWSLAVEEQFYLAFGLLLFFASRRIALGVVLFALMAKIVMYQWFGPVDMISAFCRVAFSYREPILLGVGAAFFLNDRRGYDFCKRWLGSAWICGGLGAVALLYLCLHSMRNESAADSQVLYLLLTAILMGLVVRAEAPVFSSRVLMHIGKVSYGIYLLHMFAMSIVRKFPGGSSTWISFTIGSLASIAIAAVVYRFFEQPIIAFYKRRLSAAPPTETSSPPANLSPVTPLLPTDPAS